jgi:membrane protein YqaA with SNARE-associated domain
MKTPELPKEPLPETEKPLKPRNPVRRLYNWMLSWAERPGGPIALGVITFAESSFFPIPPDPLLLALALGRPRRALFFASIATAASVAGGVFGYWLGRFLWESVSGFFFGHVPGVTPEAFASVQSLYHQYDFWAVFLAGFTPLPYKVFTLASGVFLISFPVFVVASTVSRGARFFILAGLVHFFGPQIKGFIDKHFDRLAWIFAILLVAGFFVLNFV